MNNSGAKLLAVVVLSGALSWSCGTQDSNFGSADGSVVAALEGTDDISLQTLLFAMDEGVDNRSLSQQGGDNSGSDECRELNARLAKDAREMARTPQYKALVKTKAYKDLEKDIIAMRRKHCSMPGSGGSGGGSGGGIDFECLSLQVQAYQHQQVLQATKEYKALEKTPAFKKMSKDTQEAYKKGCLEGLGGLTDIPTEDTP